VPPTEEHPDRTTGCSDAIADVSLVHPFHFFLSKHFLAKFQESFRRGIVEMHGGPSLHDRKSIKLFIGCGEEQDGLLTALQPVKRRLEEAN
jgi:hypothetical protein